MTTPSKSCKINEKFKLSRTIGIFVRCGAKKDSFCAQDFATLLEKAKLWEKRFNKKGHVNGTITFWKQTYFPNVSSMCHAKHSWIMTAALILLKGSNYMSAICKT